MKERPILFSGEMVSAILDGRKTQTRLVVDWKKVARESGCTRGRLAWSELLQGWAVFDGNGPADMCAVTCPYGQPGDRLWVLETWRECDDQYIGTCIEYRADGARIKPEFKSHETGWKCQENSTASDAHKWRPSIFMPRFSSRITLEITRVRVERVQDISDDDSLSEGVDRTNTSIPGYARERFKRLWDSINATRGYGWDANPWVWAIEFKKL
jgi:hypothetical protein